MPLDLDAIEARCAKATRGPWRPGGQYPRNYVYGPQRPELIGASDPEANGYIVADCHSLDRSGGYEEGRDGSNAAFIAAARQDVPALVAEARRLREALVMIEFFAGDSFAALLRRIANGEDHLYGPASAHRFSDLQRIARDALAPKGGA